MKNELEHKIDKTLESINGISPAEANPYLFEKIKARLNEKSSSFSPVIKWSWASICVMVLLINCGSVYYYFEKSTEQKNETAYQTIGSEMGLNQSYNY